MVSLVAGEPLSEAHPAVGVRVVVVVVVFMIVNPGTLIQGLGNGSRI